MKQVITPAPKNQISKKAKFADKCVLRLANMEGAGLVKLVVVPLLPVTNKKDLSLLHLKHINKVREKNTGLHIVEIHWKISKTVKNDMWFMGVRMKIQ